MKRTIKKQFWLTKEEAQDLQKKAKKACRSEAGLVRELVRGYSPREKPGLEFYDAMHEVAQMADRLQGILIKTRGITPEENKLLSDEIMRWRRFQADIERRFLTPDDGVAKWL